MKIRGEGKLHKLVLQLSTGVVVVWSKLIYLMSPKEKILVTSLAVTGAIKRTERFVKVVKNTMER